MPLPDFKSSEPFTLGIELELQVVNPPGTISARTPPR
jgi:carboxylate-amine ligase